MAFYSDSSANRLEHRFAVLRDMTETELRRGLTASAWSLAIDPPRMLLDLRHINVKPVSLVAERARSSERVLTTTTQPHSAVALFPCRNRWKRF